MKLSADEFDTLFGSPTKLAQKLSAALPKDEKITVGTVGVWKHRGQIPYNRVLDVERATGIARFRIRPDLYPDPAEEKARA